ncbi:hypothetical protein B1777_05010 [Dehalococcoides mccartyi]|jgi:hypothetical protein|nr:hypothetical protein dcmb_105 [Dehalococcoides mccartyi DCMB5]AQU06052.1 hypothetical protein B1777_05010 [Dehalococcoides mccartyi]
MDEIDIVTICLTIIVALLILPQLLAIIVRFFKNHNQKYYYVAYYNIADSTKMILSGPYENVVESINHVTNKPYISECIQYELKTTDLCKAIDQIEAGAKYARILQINRPPNIKN